MKIAVIYSGQLPNTFANSINTLKHADAFYKLGHSVTVFYINNKSETINLNAFYDISDEIKFISVGENAFFALQGRFWQLLISVIDFLTNQRIRFLFDAEKKIAKHILENKFDAVYARAYRVGLYLIKTGLPFVLETHAAKVENIFLKKNLALNNFNNLKICTISEILKANFVNNGMRAENIIVLEDAVDLSKYTNISDTIEVLRKRLNLPLHKTIVTYSGSLRKGKGIESLLLVAKEMQNVKEVVFLLVGGPDNFMKQQKKNVLEQGLVNVIFTGFVQQKEIPMYLKASDILIMLYSYTEKKRVMDLQTTSPIKLFEYMASKKPIIVSKISTVEKIVVANKHALMPKPDDVLEIKKSILSLINNQALNQNMANSAFELSKQHTYIKRCQKIIEEWKK